MVDSAVYPAIVCGKAMEELAEWVNPEYLSSSMLDQCAAAFSDNGSTIQLHRFLKVRSGMSLGHSRV